jgi:hypothetical protein
MRRERHFFITITNNSGRWSKVRAFHVAFGIDVEGVIAGRLKKIG